MTSLDMFLLLPRLNSLSFFVSLEFRLSYTGLPLVGLGLETYLQVRNELSQTPSGLVAKPDPRFHIVQNSANTVSIVIGPLHIF